MIELEMPEGAKLIGAGLRRTRLDWGSPAGPGDGDPAKPAVDCAYVSSGITNKDHLFSVADSHLLLDVQVAAADIGLVGLREVVLRGCHQKECNLGRKARRCPRVHLVAGRHQVLSHLQVIQIGVAACAMQAERICSEAWMHMQCTLRIRIFLCFFPCASGSMHPAMCQYHRHSPRRDQTGTQGLQMPSDGEVTHVRLMVYGVMRCRL